MAVLQRFLTYAPTLGNGEVDSSILSGSTSFSGSAYSRAERGDVCCDRRARPAKHGPARAGGYQRQQAHARRVYGGQLHLAPPTDQGGYHKVYLIIIIVGSERHDIDVALDTAWSRRVTHAIHGLS